MLAVHVSLRFVVMDVARACRSFYRFSVFPSLCESLRIWRLRTIYRLQSQYIEDGSENNHRKSFFRKAEGSLQRLE